MATAAQLFYQRLEPLAVGEDADQTFVGRFPTNLAGAAFKYTLTSRPGATKALELTTAGGGVTFAAVADGGEFVVTFTVKYRRVGAAGANTLDLTEQLYRFDLWRTDTAANVRLAAGVQPVETPARLEV